LYKKSLILTIFILSSFLISNISLHAAELIKAEERSANPSGKTFLQTIEDFRHLDEVNFENEVFKWKSSEIGSLSTEKEVESLNARHEFYQMTHPAP
jgi:hypothetical protein